MLQTDDEVNLTVPAAVPATKDWLKVLAGPEPSWRNAFVTSQSIVQDTSCIADSLRRILAPRAVQKLVIRLLGGQSNHVTYGAARSFGKHQPYFLTVDITYHASFSLINLTLFEERQRSVVPLQFKSQLYAPTHAPCSTTH